MLFGGYYIELQIKYIIGMQSQESFLLGEVVFARCGQIKPWPALITKIYANHESKERGSEIFKVKFFNHKSTANLYPSDLDKFTLPRAQFYLDKYARSEDKQERSIRRAIFLALDFIKGQKNEGSEKKSIGYVNIEGRELKFGDKKKSRHEEVNI